MNFSSQLIENAVNALAQFPGIGKKTALRLVLHLLKQPVEHTNDLSKALNHLREQIKYCTTCFNVSDTEVCSICESSSRNKSIICVVENIRDVLAIEQTEQYNGLYHVLGGVISPLDGISPDSLQIDALLKRVQTGTITEIIYALSPNIQGDTTIFYINKKLNNPAIKVTTIARGIAFGGELEYADEVTLAKSISNRMPVDSYIH